MRFIVNKYFLSTTTAMLVLLVVACSGGVNSTPKTAVEEYLKAGAAGKFDVLKSLCTDEAPQDLCNPETEDHEEVIKILKTAKIVGEPNINENMALVKVSITNGEETAEFEFPLEKQEDQWLLSGEPERIEKS